jgi:hypothetical protein
MGGTPGGGSDAVLLLGVLFLSAGLAGLGYWRYRLDERNA